MVLRIGGVKMKVGIRTPSIKRRVSARTVGRAKRAVKKAVNPLYGKKGMGIINDPKKAIYNKVYSKTSVSVDSLLKQKTGKSPNTTGSFNGIYGNTDFQSMYSEHKSNNLGMISATLFVLGVILLIVGLFSNEQFITSGICFFIWFMVGRKRRALDREAEEEIERMRPIREEHERKKRAAQESAPQWIEAIQDCAKILKSTTDPSLFFGRYDELIEPATKLAEAERNGYINTTLDASALLNEAVNNKSVQISEFINRSYRKMIKSMESLKTTNGKTKKIEGFFSKMEAHVGVMFSENLELLSNLKNECERMIAGWHSDDQSPF